MYICREVTVENGEESDDRIVIYDLIVIKGVWNCGLKERLEDLDIFRENINHFREFERVCTNCIGNKNILEKVIRLDL